jgi:hypothetical protein
MPIKSQAQRRKFAELLVEGKISGEVYERWNRGAGYKELPEHVKPKPKAKSGRTTKAKPKRKTASKTTAKRKTTSARKTTRRRAANGRSIPRR